MDIHPTYGSNDVHKLNNLDQLFDGVYNNFVEFSDYARKDGHVTLKLGSERTIKKIRAYIQDRTIAPSTTCWMRCTLLANEEMMMRRVR